MRFDWREELYQLLIGHFGDAPFDDGIREIAAIAAYHSETHEQILAAIQGACDAALTGDAGDRAQGMTRLAFVSERSGTAATTSRMPWRRDRA